ncbi:DUF427 domain-containing protein [Pseudonocardia endophytica]|uniref:Uncharacterized protein (DUF427 family) n=1 Tax=Pseudonocardia endophytica TaxID=401976 RepID=A0A4R1I184_PSEEN|nr:DUF427 domain-containing protein [Pseudonocardia endophytica]TCK27681.1 uncharacterized protein (DUF427 family) [Pseudonocardia endophytica]
MFDRRPSPERPGPGQESVWDYPRPPRAERMHRRAVLRHAGAVVAESDDLVRVLETSHPPTYYVPRTAFTDGMLVPVEPGGRSSAKPTGWGRHSTFCEWKGVASYVDVTVPGAEPLRAVGWWYPEPDRRYPELTDRVAVYVAPFDEITLDGEVVRPQPGGFYGGWVTDEVVGPFKGGPGSMGW